jgi:hypothetical protein
LERFDGDLEVGGRSPFSHAVVDIGWGRPSDGARGVDVGVDERVAGYVGRCVGRCIGR